MNIPDAIWVACIGLASGAIGSLVAPWVKWGVDRRKLVHNRRVELINKWRSFIEDFDFENDNFGNSGVYAAMRPYMDENVIKKFEAQRTFYATPDGGRGNNLFKHWASDQVSKIEKDWKLL